MVYEGPDFRQPSQIVVRLRRVTTFSRNSKLHVSVSFGVSFANLDFKFYVFASLSDKRGKDICAHSISSAVVTTFSHFRKQGSL
jgi:hypothetical protein